jgi:hypothetical protein
MKYKYLIFIISAFQMFSVKGQVAAHQDSITAPIYPDYDNVSKVHRFWLGSNNRKLWALPIKIRYVKLISERGGMRVSKAGGGMQTRSLRLKDTLGQEWVIRTLQKYPNRKLAENLKNTVADDILQDQVSAINPFGALVVPVFAKALGIPHSDPEIVYIGDDPELGKYRKDYANAIYLMECRYPLEDPKSDNTKKVQKKVQEDNEVSVDQRVVLRARLLDFLLGDWDRHEDQWRWKKIKEAEKTIYLPVPRDRDQVFYRTGGVFPWIVSHQWLKSRFQPYEGEIRDIKGWNFGARYFDRYFLNSLDEQDWIREVANFQNVVNDQLIYSAVNSLPHAVQVSIAKDITQKLKTRRNDLLTYAKEYYRFLAQSVDIPASERSELFVVKVVDPETLQLVIYKLNKNGVRGTVILQRLFKADLTKEIRLYGIAGDDIFKVEGNGKLPITVRIISGKGKDMFVVSDEVKSNGRLFIYGKRNSMNALPNPDKIKVRLSNDTSVNDFDNTIFKFNRSGPLALANYNIDQGIQLKLGFLIERQGFREIPYAAKQEFWTNYSTGRKSLSFDYGATFMQAIGSNDILVDINVYGPYNYGNFFGMGNETHILKGDGNDISYHRSRYDYATASFKLRRKNNSGWQVQYGITSEYYTSQASNNNNRYLNLYNSLHPNDDVFRNQLYLGGTAIVIYDNRISSLLPSKGTFWRTELNANPGMLGNSKFFSRIQTHLDTYWSIKDSSIVLANRVGGGTVTGDPLFFQQMRLGGINNLRGFHTNRFTGKSVAYCDIELRLKLFNFNSYLAPGSVGLVVFNDIGRVWQPGERSETWHHGYGGGINVIPANLIIIQTLAGFSKEGMLPYISLGFQF